MVKIKLKKLNIKNFKGIEELSIDFEDHTKINEIGQRDNEIYRLQSQISIVSFNIKIKKSEIMNLEEQMDKLRNEWKEVIRETLLISNDNFMCPICNMTLEPKDIISKKQELEMGFKQSKVSKLQKIKNSGKDKSDMIKELNKELAELNEQLNQFNSELLVCNEMFEVKKLEA